MGRRPLTKFHGNLQTVYNILLVNSVPKFIHGMYVLKRAHRSEKKAFQKLRNYETVHLFLALANKLYYVLFKYRLLQKQNLLLTVAAEEEFSTVSAPSTNNTFPIAIITLLSIAGVIGIVAIAIKLTTKNLQREMDNISIGSDVSTTSCTTTAEVEIVTTDKAKVEKQ